MNNCSLVRKRKFILYKYAIPTFVKYIVVSPKEKKGRHICYF